MNAEKRHEIFRRLSITITDPTTELKADSVFELLIAVMLSAQSTDVGVNKATAKLFPVANTPQAMFALGIVFIYFFSTSNGVLPLANLIRFPSRNKCVSTAITG